MNKKVIRSSRFCDPPDAFLAATGMILSARSRNFSWNKRDTECPGRCVHDRFEIALAGFLYGPLNHAVANLCHLKDFE